MTPRVVSFGVVTVLLALLGGSDIFGAFGSLGSLGSFSFLGLFTFLVTFYFFFLNSSIMFSSEYSS